MFFDDWTNLARVIITGSLAYAGTIVLLRVSGNRTLSKMNSFDLVVTVAFGSTLSSVLIDSAISLAEGLVAIALLVMLQFLITWCSVRSRSLSSLVKTQPTLVASHGNFLPGPMRRVRVTEEEIRSVVRQNGLGSMKEVAAVVMESDGSLSVISVAKAGRLDTLQGVRGVASNREQP